MPARTPKDNSYELDDLESGRRTTNGHHSSSSESSGSSEALEYINNFAYNNVRGSLLPKNRSRPSSSERQRPAPDSPYSNLDSHVRYEHYPRPVSKKNIYTIALFVALVWLVGLVTYSQIPRHGRLEDSYKDYNVTAAFGFNTTDNAIVASSSSKPTTGAAPEAVSPSSNLKRLTLDDYRSGKFFVFDKSFDFINPPSSAKSTEDEGLYHSVAPKSFVAKKLSDPAFSKVMAPRVFTYEGKKVNIDSISPNHDLSKAIVQTNSESQWRHSGVSQFFLYDTASQSFEPLYDDGSKTGLPKLSFAQWSPNYNFISFVYEHNVYVKDLASGTVSQVTTDGGADIFNGKPDWVYEEEVVASDKLLWWSPNEENIVFIKTNDTDVPVYELDYYTKNGNDKYPTHRPIKYPKPGYSNPVLSIINYNIKTGKSYVLDHSDADGKKLGKEFIVYDIFWLNDNDFIAKEADRESNLLHYRKYDHESSSSSVVRAIDAEKDFGGWIDKDHVQVIRRNSKLGRTKDGYIDITVDNNGFSHLAYFEGASSEPVKYITEGDFDDKTGHMAFDYEKNVLYFTSTKQSSMSLHLYSVELDLSSINSVPKLNPLTKDDELGYYEPKFSPGAKYVSLSYKGPRLPTQKIIDLHDSFHQDEYFSNVKSIINSDMAAEAHKQYAVPEKQFTEIEIDSKSKLSVNVLETRPQNFDPSKKYPLLVTFYGGPGSQRVEAKYDVGFSEVVASSLDAVVLLIDPRGTDSKGWSFKKWARNKIGYWEPRDIIAATKKYIDDKRYIDEERTVAWGWSYSGFVTLKTLEVDDDQVFKFGAAVAPVTDWRLYDSIYTERYISTPDNNPKGYEFATVGGTKEAVDKFKQKKRFLVMHGTGDDNVHIQNTFALFDRFNLGGVENFDMKIFPDSDHSIYYHNANTIVFDKLFNWIKDAFNGSLDNLSS